MRDVMTVVVVSVVFGGMGAVFAWLMREPVVMTLPCAEQCGYGWRGVEFSGGCACVQEVRP